MDYYFKRVAICFTILTAFFLFIPGVGLAAGIPGSVLPVLSQPGCEKLTAVAPDQSINLTIVLKSGGKAAQSFTPPSPTFVTSLTNWLTANGLTVTNNLNGGLVLQCSASVDAAEKALGVSLVNYTYKGQSFFANDTPPVLPDDLASGINGIFGLDNLKMVKSMLRQVQIDNPKQSSGSNLHPLNLPVRTAGTPPYIPTEIQKAYGFDQVYDQGINGAGITAAVVTFASFNQSDIDTFFNDLGTSYSGGIEVIPVDGGSGSVNFTDGSSIETSMDIENLLSSAPGCHLLVYEANNSGSTDGMIDVMSRLVSDNRARVVSLSWGFDDAYLDQEYYNSMDTILAAGAARGITFVGASGDNGGGCPVYPSDDPYFTSVGGTSLTLNQADGTVVSENGWSGSGGGPSSIIPLPAWQSGSNMPSASTRMAPDVAFNADPETGYALYYDGAWNYTNNISDGGTSAAAPEVAAALALADQAMIKEKNSYLGAANQQLYTLAESGQSDFRSITSGNNGFYQCSNGYNMVTGWGVPQVKNLVMDLSGLGQTSAASLSLNVTGPLTGGGQYLVQAGSNVTIQASGSSTGNYYFWVCDPVKGWYYVPQQITNSQLSLTNVANGTYIVDVYNGISAVGARFVFNVGSSVALAVTVNADGTYTATAIPTNVGANGGAPYYAFYYTLDGTNYNLVGNFYSATNTATIPAGAKQVIVYAKDKNSPLGWQFCVAAVQDIN